jgi:hypothetical protein
MTNVSSNFLSTSVEKILIAMEYDSFDSKLVKTAKHYLETIK